MSKDTLRIDAVSVTGPSTLRICWRGELAADEVNLAGWIASGGDTFSTLLNAEIFQRALVAHYGAAVVWGENTDLAIDAVHLKRIIDEQCAR